MRKGNSFMTAPGELEFRVVGAPHRDGVNIIVIARDRATRKKYVAEIKSIKWNEFGEGQEYPCATLSVSAKDAIEMQQGLNDTMGDLGMKSDTHAALEGELKATKYHLEDMRKIVLQPPAEFLQPVKMTEEERLYKVGGITMPRGYKPPDGD